MLVLLACELSFLLHGGLQFFLEHSEARVGEVYRLLDLEEKQILQQCREILDRRTASAGDSPREEARQPKRARELARMAEDPARLKRRGLRLTSTVGERQLPLNGHVRYRDI